MSNNLKQVPWKKAEQTKALKPCVGSAAAGAADCVITPVIFYYAVLRNSVQAQYRNENFRVLSCTSF